LFRPQYYYIILITKEARSSVKPGEKQLEMQVSEQIEILKNTLKEKFAVKQIFVFGSHAYGEPDKDSDIDLCVITDLDNKRKIDIIREIRRELIELISNPLDILIYSEKKLRKEPILEVR
jgi:predicted nucleotidyltransferase